jgi:hypothetical protein
LSICESRPWLRVPIRCRSEIHRRAVSFLKRGGVGGLEVIAADLGPGIERPSIATQEKTKPSGSLGAGLAAVLRLADEVAFDNRSLRAFASSRENSIHDLLKIPIWQSWDVHIRAKSSAVMMRRSSHAIPDFSPPFRMDWATGPKRAKHRISRSKHSRKFEIFRWTASRCI